MSKSDDDEDFEFWRQKEEQYEDLGYVRMRCPICGQTTYSDTTSLQCRCWDTEPTETILDDFDEMTK